MAFITSTKLRVKEPTQQQLLAAPRCRNAQAANFHPYKWPLCFSEGGQTANQYCKTKLLVLQDKATT